MEISSLITRTPFNAHLHLRNGKALETTVPHAAESYGGAIVMPNLKPPITTVAQAEGYRAEILANVPKGVSFEPYMTLYLTDWTSPSDIAEIADHPHGVVVAVKLYPANATTNSASGVTDVDKCLPVLEAMEKYHVPLCVHAEVSDPNVDVFDREAVFVDRVLRGIVDRFPDLRVVMEHVTTKDGVDFVSECGPNVAASITAHHLLFDRNDIFRGGIRPHYYCLPILKRSIHRDALVRAATSGSRKFFAGDDSAPHAKGTKEAACGCAGCYTAPFAPEMYLRAFVKAGAFGDVSAPSSPEKTAAIVHGAGVFEKFVSSSACAFYAIPELPGKIRFRRIPRSIPSSYPYGDGDVLVPLLAGEEIEWSAERISE